MRRGGRFPLLLLAFFSLWIASRLAPHDREPPAFFVFTPPYWQVALSESWSRQGVHQFFDDSVEECVNVLTISECQALFVDGYRGVSGVEVALSEAENVVFLRWMPASQRIALQIPLHPDRMLVDDWQALPGIGPALAQRIEMDRQKNGDFRNLEALTRVRGIGKKRLTKIYPYFE